MAAKKRLHVDCRNYKEFRIYQMGVDVFNLEMVPYFSTENTVSIGPLIASVEQVERIVCILGGKQIDRDWQEVAKSN